MQCQYCGKQFLIGSRMTGDTDFCAPGHRERFHQSLATAMRRIQDEASPSPTGQPGFHAQTAVFDRAAQSMSWAPMAPARLRPASLLSFCMTAAGADVLREAGTRNVALVEAEMRDQDETAISIQQPDRAPRLKRISSMLSEIREDIEKRRRDTIDLLGQVGRAPVIQLKAAV